MNGPIERRLPVVVCEVNFSALVQQEFYCLLTIDCNAPEEGGPTGRVFLIKLISSLVKYADCLLIAVTCILPYIISAGVGCRRRVSVFSHIPLFWTDLVFIVVMGAMVLR